MEWSRRRFVLLAALGIPVGCSPSREIDRPAPPPETPAEMPARVAVRPPDGPTNGILKPARLKDGATVGLVSPGGAIFEPEDVIEVEEILRGLGLQTLRGRHVLDRRGYLAGTDDQRAADLHRMFADPDVDVVLALRGGWGCNRILPLLDYDLIRAHPKIFMGFSDITSLLLALYACSGLVTFHGPVGISSWTDFTVDYARRVLFDGEAVTMRNPRRIGPRGPIMQDRTLTIRPGKAQGLLAGGNLSVLVSMIGSSYLPEWDGHILFLEDTREDVYRVDRMLMQLSMAGVLPRLAGIVFGKCTNCDPDEPSRSLTLREVLSDHLRPLGIPCFYGSMIGHIRDKFTVPVGVRAEIDASAGTIKLLERAVV